MFPILRAVDSSRRAWVTARRPAPVCVPTWTPFLKVLFVRLLLLLLLLLLQLHILLHGVCCTFLDQLVPMWSGRCGAAHVPHMVRAALAGCRHSRLLPVGPLTAPCVVSCQVAACASGDCSLTAPGVLWSAVTSTCRCRWWRGRAPPACWCHCWNCWWRVATAAYLAQA